MTNKTKNELKFKQVLMVRILRISVTLVNFLIYIGCWLLISDSSEMIISTHHQLPIIFTVGYLLLSIIFIRALDGYDIGIRKVSDNFFSLEIAYLVIDVLFYFGVIITLAIWASLWYLIVAFILQTINNAIYVRVANRYYFKVYPPKEILILYNNKQDLERINLINYFDLKYRIVSTIRNPEKAKSLEKQIQKVDAVMILGITTSIREDLIKIIIKNNKEVILSPEVNDVILTYSKQINGTSIPLYSIKKPTLYFEYAIAKRLFDIVASLVLLIILSPLLIGVMIAIKIYDGGPVLYKQMRLTKDGELFYIIKFRSMRENAEKDGVARLAYEDDDRITPVGKFIRSTRIDELPQLINILIGQMSFVGPRPERPESAKQYEEQYPDFNFRLQVKAGLTGYAQVYGKYNTDPLDKLKMDMFYINNMSVLFDLKMMFITTKTIFMNESTEGIARANQNSKRSKNNLVSIVVPVYNAEEYIAKTIKSVQEQTYKNWELLLINDCSTDSSKKIASKYLSKNIKWFDLDKNSGAAISRNKGIDKAKGRFICFLDADDLWEKEKLEKQIRFMNDKDVAFSFTSYAYADDKGIKNGKIAHVPQKISYSQALKNTIIFTSTVMFNMEKLTKEDIHMPDIRRGQDSATWWKVLKKVNYAYGIDEVLSVYRRPKNTLSSNKIEALKRTWRLYRKVEHLNIFSASFNFVCYCVNAVLRRI